MAKYSFEEKMEAVLRVVNDGMSPASSARILGAGTEHVRRWVHFYKEHGAEGLSMKHGTYTGEFKIHAVEYMHTNQLSLSEASLKLGIPKHGTLSKWERIYYEEGPQGLYEDHRGRKSKMSSDKPKKKLNKQTEEDLIAEVQRLRMENEYLKKLNALVQERIARENGNELPSSKN